MNNFQLIYRKYFYFLIGILFIFIPLFPKFPLENISGTFVAIRYEDVLIALVVFVWFVFNIRNLRKYFSNIIFQAFILFWLIGLLSLFSGIFITHTISLKLALFHWLRRVEYMSLFLIAATSVSSLNQAKFLIKISLVGALIVIFYGFGQIYFNFPVISTTNREFSKGLILYLTNGARVNSTFAGHYDLAMYLSIILMIIATNFFYYRKILNKLMIAFVGFISFALLGLTAARVSFVATILGLAAVFWLNQKKVLLVLLIFLVIASVGLIPELRHRLVATVTVNLLNGGGPKYTPAPGTITDFTPIDQIPENIRQQVLEDRAKRAANPGSPSTIVYKDTVAGEPVNSTELGVYRSFGIRLNVEWPRAINSFLRNPFLGTGYSSISLATDNDFLRSLGEVGILGTLSLALIFYILIKSLLKVFNQSQGFEKYYLLSMITSVVVILVTATVIDVLEASKVAELLWIWLGIAWAIITDYKLGKNENE
ncbi:O-antigen ligase family protein [Candidatus Daviesbacteria bacterium]|nr:O-antigen ligase family protein [Candidatus Daviesbacteria bacterium]